MTTINDFSPKPKTVSLSGNAIIASGHGKFGAGSLYCPDLGSFLYIDNNKDFNLSDTEYTIECWIKPSGDYTSKNTIITKRSEASGCAWELYLNASNGRLGFYNGVAYTGSSAPLSGSWSHIAAVHQTGSLKLYLNGSGILSTSISNTNINAPIYIGSYPPTSEQYLGYIDDIRITKGVSGARYLTDFIPPSGPFPTSGTPITGPTEPINLTNTIGDASLTLSWFAPIDDNGDDVIDYTIEYTENNTNTNTINLGRATGLVQTLTGLNNGSSYVVRLAAINTFATGAYSTTSGIPGTVPSTITTLTASPSDSSIYLSWDAPFNGGRAINDYIIKYNSGIINQYINTNNLTNYTFNNLVNGNTYIFSVAAINILGTGAYSNTITGIPATVPSAPTGLVLSASDSYSLNFSWLAPYNGGSPITDYAVQYSSDSGATWLSYNEGVSTLTTASLTGLVSDSTYIAKVAAVNIYGTGLYSSGSNPIRLSLAPICDFVVSGIINPSCDFTVSGLPDIVNTSSYVYDKPKIYSWWD